METVDYKIKKHSILQVFLFMYVLYPFRPGPLTIPVKLGYYLFVFYSAIKFYKSISLGKITNKNLSFIFAFIAAFFVCVFISVLYPVIQNTWDFSFFAHFVNYFILYVCSILMLKYSDNIYDFIVLFLKANTLYVICSLILLVPNIRLSYQDFTGIITNDSLMNSWEMKVGLYYTRYGLQGFSGFAHTFRCSFAFSLGCWLLSLLNTKKKRIIVLFYMMFNFIGCCLYGRVGILASLLVLFAYSFYTIIKFRKYKILFFIVVSVFFLCFCFIYFYDLLKEITFVKFAFEPFINLIEKGVFETASSNGLKTHWRVPSLKAVAWGDALYTEEDGRYYTHVDVGFIRPLLFWGLLGSFVYYWMVIFLVISIVNRQKKNGFILGCIIICLTIFYEIKGECVPDMIQILIPMALVLYKSKFASFSILKNMKNYLVKV